MTKKKLPEVTVTLDRIIGGGQAIGTLPEGKKCLVWGGLPGEEVVVQLTKKKSSFVEGYVTEVIKPSTERIAPRDPDSYLSTSPWQILDFASENHYKSALIEEAFELHDIVLPAPITVWSDGHEFEYRNKVEYSFWFDTDKETLDLAFFRRGTHGKITVQNTSLASPAINSAAKSVLAALRDLKIDGRTLKTLMIRSNRGGDVAWQLYVKNEDFEAEKVLERAISPEVICAEVIYSNPKSPASVITKRLAATSDKILTDTILDIPFRYATEGFFQINLPVYEHALRDMAEWVKPEDPRPLDLDAVQGDSEARNVAVSNIQQVSTGADNAAMRQIERPVVDLYSGVGTIGLTIGGKHVTLVELNEHAVREMEQNIIEHGRQGEAHAILSAAEDALEHINGDAAIIVDPPRAGLHEKLVDKLLETAPARIIYLSCNPVTQARDVARLADKYGIRWHQGYNFFPRTPHIEHLVILDKI